MRVTAGMIIIVISIAAVVVAISSSPFARTDSDSAPTVSEEKEAPVDRARPKRVHADHRPTLAATGAHTPARATAADVDTAAGGSPGPIIPPKSIDPQADDPPAPRILPDLPITVIDAADLGCGRGE